MKDELTYKGVTIKPRFNAEDGKIEATILLEGGRAFINGESVKELEQRFHQTVDVMEKRKFKPRPPSLLQRAAKFLKSA